MPPPTGSGAGTLETDGRHPAHRTGRTTAHPRLRQRSQAMARTDFEDRIARLEAMIEQCPPDQREALRHLATETRQRQEAVDADIDRARRGLEALRLTEEIAALNHAMLLGAVDRIRPVES